jgi:hypothetical protein
MPYTPNSWVDGPAGNTPITAAQLSHVETQYTQAVADITARNTINVKKLGAAGDGVTDDRPAIQAALDAAGTGGAVYFPPGTYLLNSFTQTSDRILKTYPGQTLYGQSKFSSVLKVANSFPDYVTVIGAANDSTAIGTWVMSNMGIDQNSATNPLNIPSFATYPRMAVRLGSNSAGSSVTVSDCAFMNGDSVNAVYTFADTLDIRGNQFLNQGGPVGTSNHDHSTIYLSTPTSNGTQAVVGNTFKGVLSSGGARTAVETHGGIQTVTGNAITSYTAGMNLTGIEAHYPCTGVICTGNVISHVSIGIHIWAQYSGAVTTGAVMQNVIIADNAISIDRDPWSAISGYLAYAYGVIIDPANNAPIDGLSINNNSILYLPSTGTAPATDRHSTGINVEISSTAAELRNLQIIGNTITAPLSAGMNLSGTIKRGSVSDNTVIDPAQSTEASVVSVYRSGMVLGGTMEDVGFERNKLIDTRGTHVAIYNINVASTLTVATNCWARNNVTRFADGVTPLASFQPSSANTSGTEFFVEELNALGSTPSYNTKVGSTVTVAASGKRLVQTGSPVGATWSQALAVGATVGTTAPSAGAAGALPATPAGYITLSINGTTRQLPYY